MIEIYNRSELLPMERTLIDDVEVFFPMLVHSKYFIEQDIEILQTIDNAVLLDKETQTIETAFGVTSLDNVSSGCKVALIYSALLQNEDTWGKEFALDLTECGANALNVIFTIAQQSCISIPFVLRHANVAKVKEFDFLFNGTKKGRDLYEL